jgi:LPXTG-motif cell wall-anchored protein
MTRWNCASACRNLAAVAGTLTVLVSGIPSAQAAPDPQAGPRSLAVSVPAEAAPLEAGATGTVPIRVVNPGSRPVAVRITGQGVRFADEGRITIAGRDPMWDGRVDFPARPMTISAQSYRDVDLAVHMPTHISPDLYFIGFLVTPLPGAAGNLTYINQIGSYITIDVPGPRTRTLAADLDLPSFALTSHLHAKLHVHNVGKSAAMFWGENDTTAAPGSSAPTQARLERSLLPAGRSRTIVVEAKPSFLVAMVTMRVHILYPGRTDAGTTEIVLTKRVLVVQPAAVVLLGALLIVAGIWYARRRRKRRRQRKPRPSPHRPVGPTRTASRTRRSRSGRQRVPADAAVAARIDRRLAQARAHPKLS